MKIAALTLSFPVLEIHSTVTYAVLRKPTLFEKAILEVVAEFATDKEYGEMSLQKVFGEMLAVPEEESFVQPALSQLLEMGMLEGPKETASMQNIKLRDLRLTDTGEEMRARGAFPGVQQQQRFVHLYDPIRDRLLNSEEKAALSESPEGTAVDIENEQLVAKSLIERTIRGRSGEMENDIRQIDTGAIETRWLTHDGDLALSETGELSIRLGDDFYDDYFRHFSSKWLFDNFLSDFLTDASIEKDLLKTKPKTFSKIAKKAEAVFPARDLDMKMKLSGKMTHFLRYQPYLKNHLKCKRKTLLVVFGYPEGDAPVKIDWSDALNGAVIFLDKSFPVKGCYYLNAERENLFVDLFEIIINGDPYPAPLGYPLKKDRKEVDPQPLYEILSPLIDQTGEVQHQLIKLFWRPAEEVWQKIKEMTT